MGNLPRTYRLSPGETCPLPLRIPRALRKTISYTSYAQRFLTNKGGRSPRDNSQTLSKNALQCFMSSRSFFTATPLAPHDIYMSLKVSRAHGPGMSLPGPHGALVAGWCVLSAQQCLRVGVFTLNRYFFPTAEITHPAPMLFSILNRQTRSTPFR